MLVLRDCQSRRDGGCPRCDDRCGCTGAVPCRPAGAAGAEHRINNTKNPNPSPSGKRFGFSLFDAPPGTRTLGPLIKRSQRATIVNFRNSADSSFLSFYREFEFCICCILCTCYPLLHPLSSRSGVQKVCKNVQSQNQPLKTDIGFLYKAVKMGWFSSKTASAISPI